MPDCIAIRHLAFEDLGYFDDVLRDAGFGVRYLDAPAASGGDIENLETGLLIVLGGPLGANDENDYPFLAAELRLLERRLEHNRPTLGICLGAQLMARALGARVAPGVCSEIGWLPLRLTPAGGASPLKHFDGVPVFHWHSDAFDLPEHALPLASTADCPHQGFALGPNILGLQFHPEVTARGLESWYVGHYRALSDDNAPEVAQLRADAARHAAALRERGTRFFTEWLAKLRFE